MAYTVRQINGSKDKQTDSTPDGTQSGQLSVTTTGNDRHDALAGSFSYVVCDSCWDRWTKSTTNQLLDIHTPTQRKGYMCVPCTSWYAVDTTTEKQPTAMGTASGTCFSFFFFFVCLFVFFETFLPAITCWVIYDCLQSPIKDESKRVNDR